MSLRIAIPSYKRSKILKTKTLPFLIRSGFNPADIYVFVATEEEKQNYTSVLDPSTYNEIVLGVPTLFRQRLFIRNYFPVGTRVLSLDDDIKDIIFKNPQHIPTFVQTMFDLSIQEGVSLWGLYPCDNKFFMKERVMKGLQFIIGQVYGFIAKPIPEEDITMDLSSKEDVWLSLYLYKKEGATLRYEGAAAKTRMFAPGGLSEFRTTESESIVTDLLAAEYPDLCAAGIKKNGMKDVLFKKLGRTTVQLPHTQ